MKNSNEIGGISLTSAKKKYFSTVSTIGESDSSSCHNQKMMDLHTYDIQEEKTPQRAQL